MVISYNCLSATLQTINPIITLVPLLVFLHFFSIVPNLFRKSKAISNIGYNGQRAPNQKDAQMQAQQQFDWYGAHANCAALIRCRFFPLPYFFCPFLWSRFRCAKITRSAFHMLHISYAFYTHFNVRLAFKGKFLSFSISLTCFECWIVWFHSVQIPFPFGFLITKPIAVWRIAKCSAEQNSIYW